jgi:hypothetical protein
VTKVSGTGAFKAGTRKLVIRYANATSTIVIVAVATAPRLVFCSGSRPKVDNMASLEAG